MTPFRVRHTYGSMVNEEQGRPARSTAVKPVDTTNEQREKRTDQDLERDIARWQQRCGMMMTLIERHGDEELRKIVWQALSDVDWEDVKAKVSGVLAGAVAAGIVSWVKKEE